jgi:hypothetical protein
VPQDVGRDFFQLVLGVREKALPHVHVCCHFCLPVGARGVERSLDRCVRGALAPASCALECA